MPKAVSDSSTLDSLSRNWTLEASETVLQEDSHPASSLEGGCGGGAESALYGP